MADLLTSSWPQVIIAVLLLLVICWPQVIITDLLILILCWPQVIFADLLILLICCYHRWFINALIRLFSQVAFSLTSLICWPQVIIANLLIHVNMLNWFIVITDLFHLLFIFLIFINVFIDTCYYVELISLICFLIICWPQVITDLTL